MALEIDDAATERSARELAVATGESIADAVRSSIEERLARVRRAPPESIRDVLHAIVERGRTRADVEGAADDVLGYGRNGLPT